MIILGVDPGSQRTGYGVIDTDGRRHRLLTHGAITTPARTNLPLRLSLIHAGVSRLIEAHRPEALAVEDVFHAVNTRSALVLGHVRGVILLAGAQAGLPVHEFPPATVKVQVTGYGRAEKAQMQRMVQAILRLESPPKPDHAADALAVGICHALAPPLLKAVGA